MFASVGCLRIYQLVELGHSSLIQGRLEGHVMAEGICFRKKLPSRTSWRWGYVRNEDYKSTCMLLQRYHFAQ